VTVQDCRVESRDLVLSMERCRRCRPLSRFAAAYEEPSSTRSPTKTISHGHSAISIVLESLPGISPSKREPSSQGEGIQAQGRS